MQNLLSFPNPVNEKAARVVAGVVLLTALVILATGAYWLLIPLAYGFWARVLTGPTLSPLGWIAQNARRDWGRRSRCRDRRSALPRRWASRSRAARWCSV